MTILKEEKNTDRNMGICLLRLMMSFVVIICHYYTGNIKVILMTRNLAVPVFMLISFLYFKNILTENNKKIIERLKRLLYPYVIWPVIYWLIYNLLYLLARWDYRTSFDSLIWQITFGSSAGLIPQFWYMFDLIVITILMLSGLYRQGGGMCALCIICLFLQYGNINTYLFENLPYEIKWSVGRLVEMIPYAVIGIMLEHSGILNQCSKKKSLSIVVLLIAGGIVILSNRFSIIKNPDSGFYYQGIYLILISVILVMIFYLLPVEWLNVKICNFICALSKYSLGIYALHFMIGRIMNTILSKGGWACNSFLQCILIFIISLLFSYLISKLPFKWCKKIVT